MDNLIFISIPSDDLELITEIQRELAPYIRIHDASHRDISTLKFVLEFVGETIGIAGGVAGILTYFQNTRDRAIKTKKPSGVNLTKQGIPVIYLDDADDRLLKQLLDIED